MQFSLHSTVPRKLAEHLPAGKESPEFSGSHWKSPTSDSLRGENTVKLSCIYVLGVSYVEGTICYFYLGCYDRWVTLHALLQYAFSHRSRPSSTKM